VRSTVCFRKTDGAWSVAHEHTSVTFDAESGRASVNLRLLFRSFWIAANDHEQIPVGDAPPPSGHCGSPIFRSRSWKGCVARMTSQL
jgi:hypothetical protein